MAVPYTLTALTNFHVQQKLVTSGYLEISTGTKDGSHAKADFWVNNKTAREAQIYLIHSVPQVSKPPLNVGIGKILEGTSIYLLGQSTEGLDMSLTTRDLQTYA